MLRKPTTRINGLVDGQFLFAKASLEGTHVSMWFVCIDLILGEFGKDMSDCML